MDGVLAWMESSRLARLVLENAWVFPTLETLHFFGLILLIGSLYVVDLRFLGLAPRIPLNAVMPFIPVSMIGFGINLVTGTMFLFSDPSRYYSNFAFRVKMLTILLAGLNAIWFKFALHADIISDTTTDPPTLAKWIAGLSMLLWTTVIVLGRMIPYVE